MTSKKNTSTAFTLEVASLVFVVLIVQAMELLLLARKYDLFTGGFLQPFSFRAWSDRLLFVGLSLWTDLVFFGLLAVAWYALASRWKISLAKALYGFTLLILFAMGGWLALKYKVLSYFSDTINLLIVKNLAGGSLQEAFGYVADEALLVVPALIAAVALAWLGFRLLARVIPATIPSTPLLTLRPALFVTLLATAATLGLVLVVESNPLLRYGMLKKTSYQLISQSFDRISDLDRDGYGMVTFPADPAPLDPRRYPGALDYPDNGLDEDGYAGDFHWDPRQTDDLLSRLQPRPGKHIVLIVLESARSDLLDKRLNGRLVAPHIDALARDGSRIERAFSHTGFTTSSIKALLTRSLSGGSDRIRLTDYLRRAGYQLSFISGQDESFGGMDNSTGMSAPGNYLFDARSAIGDRVFGSKAPGSLRLSEARVVQAFDERTGEVDWKTPQFFYINLQAAHFPYSHPTMPALINEHPIPRSEINAGNGEWLRATYWNAIAVADQAVGAIVARLRKLGVYGDTVLLVTGDHGESLFDDGFLGHGHALSDVQTHIPLVVNQPGVKVSKAVGQTEVGELLVELASHRFEPGRWQGRDRPVFQVVGSLNRPVLIGTVTADGTRTTLDLRERRVFFSDTGRWLDFDAALQDPRYGSRVRTLVERWEAIRWRSHLSRHPAPSPAAAPEKRG
ncbi:MAG TPA: hypothetical protein ENK50_09170 [Sedimenticola sp.]|nr:hypothetical protein [Sedimenticola sp.]